jgi:hypothetical protein
MKRLLLVLSLSFCTLYVTDMHLQAQNSATYETNVTFHNFPWGTSMEEVKKKMGKPISQEEINGLVSLTWEKIEFRGYTTFMLAYFSKSGLQAGTYYFLTYDMDQLMRCYTVMRQELLDRYGPTQLYDIISRDLRPYESSWNLPGGYVYLKVNTRQGEPVTLWYFSPELTKQLFGDTNSRTPR